MRNIEETRAFILERLQYMLQAPGMHSSSARDFEFMCMMELELLDFIDNREGALRFRSSLRKMGFWGSCGACTPFMSRWPEDESYLDELAMLYAAISREGGYLEPQRLLQREEWEELLRWTTSQLRDCVWRLEQVKELFGEPSFQTIGNGARARLYTTGQEREWLVLSFINRYDETLPEKGYPAPARGENPFLFCSFSPDNSRKPVFLWTKYGAEIVFSSP